MIAGGVRLVAIPPEAWEQRLATLARDARASAAASLTALPGDTEDIHRYSELAGRIEQVAAEMPGVPVSLFADSPDWAGSGPRDSWALPRGDLPGGANAAGLWAREQLESGFAVVELHGFGTVARGGGKGTDAAAMVDPLPVFRAEQGRHPGAQRFDAQVEALGDGSPINPTGVPNAVLEAGLRRIAIATDAQATFARIVYADGSEARPFPWGGAPIGSTVPAGLRTVPLAMISMRHPEMDVEVAGALLRNAEVSRMVAQAHMDETAYVKALEMLGSLLDRGPVNVRLHQTGLQPAVVGIYRAVCELLSSRRDLVVTPVHLRQKGRRRVWIDGAPWAPRDGA